MDSYRPPPTYDDREAQRYRETVRLEMEDLQRRLDDALARIAALEGP